MFLQCRGSISFLCTVSNIRNIDHSKNISSREVV
uniref:Uncharacterized protein n=1 Tax=Musa acuminata subsp. malaccensis TaxID=214687 RepID=A0A804HY00_MUSAM